MNQGGDWDADDPWLPIHYAVTHNHNVDVISTLLHWSPETVAIRLLLSRGACAHSEDVCRCTPADYAASSEVADFIRRVSTS